MKEKIKPLFVTAAEYAFIILIVLFFTYRILGLEGVQLADYPMMYQTDDPITGLVTVKSMEDNGWIYENYFLGAPNGMKNYDFTTMDIFLNAMEQVLVWITGNWILAYNLFYLSGYFLVAITAYYALKQLKIPVLIALPTSILYTFLPYHQLRGTGHLFLSMYFMVPLMVLYIYRLMNGELLFHKGEKGWLTRPNIIRFITLMIMSITGIYYAFFTCFFLCVVILYCLLNKEDRQKIIQSMLSICIIVCTLVISALPNLIYWIQNGKPEAISKEANGAEVYALKIIQLLLPRQGHRREVLMRLRNLYDSAYPLTNENGISSLGIIMAGGFVILCLILFMRKWASDKPSLQIGSILNLAAVLFGTVGGYAVVLSFFTGAIRCYNRLSIFIAMFSLIAVDSIIQMIYEKWFQSGRMKAVFLGGMIILLLGGIYDQTVPVDPELYKLFAQWFDDDEMFVQRIEAIEEEGAMIYQMPYMRYPENGNINYMSDYAHMIGYLHSDTLRWSYGVPVGRDGDLQLQAIDALPIQELIAAIQEAGYAGIYVDWDAYLQDEHMELESVLLETVSSDPIENGGRSKAYYSFQNQ